MTRIDRHGAITVVRPTGPLRADAIEPLSNELESMLNGGIPFIIVDLSETPLIDSAGLEWLLDFDEMCCRRGGCLRICGAGELCRDILRVTAVGASVEQFDDLTIALGSFA